MTWKMRPVDLLDAARDGLDDLVRHGRAGIRRLGGVDPLTYRWAVFAGLAAAVAVILAILFRGPLS